MNNLFIVWVVRKELLMHFHTYFVSSVWSGRVAGGSAGWACYGRSGGWRRGRGQSLLKPLKHKYSTWWISTFPNHVFPICGLTHFFGLQDTDSLMEWWYTVERESHSAFFEKKQQDIVSSLTLQLYCISEWDELPSDEEDRVIKEDESRYLCFNALGWSKHILM